MSPAETSAETVPSSPFGVWEWARVDPHRIALETAAEKVTFGALAARANQLSRAFRALGVGREDVVAAIVKNEKEYFELASATGQIGAYLLVVNWHLTPEEILYILADSKAVVLLADDEFGLALLENWNDLPADRFSIGEQLAGWQRYEDLGVEQSDAAIEDRCYGAIMGYTSGTTGRPKGVRRVLADVSPEEGAGIFRPLLGVFGIAKAEGRHLLCSPVYHAAPAGYATGALSFGQTVVIHERFSPEAVLHSISDEGITNSHMVPTHFHRLLQLPEELRNSVDLSSLEALVHAGAPCPPEIKRDMIAWVGPVIWEYLGATEGFVSFVSSQTWLERPGTVGRPLVPGGVIVKKEDGSYAQPGEEGTIFFKTTTPFEYHNDPAKTAASRHGDFVTVGDLGCIDDDGYLYLLDRRTDLIVSGGVNIYPAEVEAALITHPFVQDVGVIGVTDPEWGRRVVAVIQPVDGVGVTAELVAELEAFAKSKLPSYKRPRAYEFLIDFPRTEAGKVRRRDLRDVFDPDRPATTAVRSH